MAGKPKTSPKGKSSKADVAAPALDPEQAAVRLAGTGRNDPCSCGSGKKYKKCHMRADEAVTAPRVAAPDAKELVAEGWRLFEQRRPGAAEKQFRAALAIDAGSVDAAVGVGMAKLSAGDTDTAKAEFETVLKTQAKMAAALQAKGTKDGFSLPEAQAYIRAAHALGCLAYDKDDHELAVSSLQKVYAIDEGAVGTEARLVAAKAFMKLGRPADAVAMLEPAASFETGKVRAFMGLALAHFAAGDKAKAEKDLARALSENAHFGKAILGLVRAKVDHPAAATPGSREEAALYAQGFGDVWDEPGKEFLRAALAAGAGEAAGSSQGGRAGAEAATEV